MKQKKMMKTLSLNKKTVSNLSSVQMETMKGGKFTDSRDLPCNSNELYCTVATCDPYFCLNSAQCSEDLVIC